MQKLYALGIHLAIVASLTISVFPQGNSAVTSVYWVWLTVVPSNPKDCLDQHPLLLELGEDGSMVLNHHDKVVAQQIRHVFHDILQTRFGDGKEVLLKANGKLRYADVARIVKELSSSDPGIRIVLPTPTLQSSPCVPAPLTTSH
jgi:biopolymer transport protein ExbD